jgi:hypothetical protein
VDGVVAPRCCLRVMIRAFLHHVVAVSGGCARGALTAAANGAWPLRARSCGYCAVAQANPRPPEEARSGRVGQVNRACGRPASSDPCGASQSALATTSSSIGSRSPQPPRSPWVRIKARTSPASVPPTEHAVPQQHRTAAVHADGLETLRTAAVPTALARVVRYDAPSVSCRLELVIAPPPAGSCGWRRGAGWRSAPPPGGREPPRRPR